MVKLTFVLVVFTVVAQGWVKGKSVINANVKRDLASDDNDGLYDIDELRRNYAQLLDEMSSNTKDELNPFGFGISRSTAFHGKRNLNNGYFNPGGSRAFHGKRSFDDAESNELDDQNTSVFHGKKRAAENVMAAWLDSKPRLDSFPGRKIGNRMDSYPRRRPSNFAMMKRNMVKRSPPKVRSSAFHGKKDTTA